MTIQKFKANGKNKNYTHNIKQIGNLHGNSMSYVKSEIAYLLFTGSEPDILFNKLMVTLNRISIIPGCNVPIGRYGFGRRHSNCMEKSIYSILNPNHLMVGVKVSLCL